MARVFLWVFGGLVLLVGLGSVVLFEADLPAAEVDARYTNAESQFLLLPSGARVHYRDQGNRTGLPVVLLHGSNASLHTWEALIVELGDTYRVITLDLPAHGLTGQVPDNNYSMQAYVDATLAVTDHLALDQFVLGGNSMGGGVTWQLALQQPSRVLAMLLLNSSAPGYLRQTATVDQSSNNRQGPLAFRLLRQPWFRSLAQRLDTEWLVKQGLMSAHYDPAIVTDALIARYYELSMRAGSREATLARFNQPRTTVSAAQFEALTQPSLVLWGAEDAVIPVSVGDLLHEALPNSELVVFDQIGHIPMEEDPQATAKEIRNFLLQSLGSLSGCQDGTEECR